MKQFKVSHGGKRTPGPGKKLGPPRNPYPLRLIKIACTEEEYQAILKLSTRERTEVLLRATVQELLSQP